MFSSYSITGKTVVDNCRYVAHMELSYVFLKGHFRILFGVASKLSKTLDPLTLCIVYTSYISSTVFLSIFLPPVL